MITYTGKFLNGPEDSPDVVDIAVSLARMCRFNGFCTIFWSVLQHSFAVEQILDPEYKMYGLLHDAAESVVGDIPRPVKLPIVSKMEDDIMKGIYATFNLPEPTPKIKLHVKEADDRILYAECVLFGPPETHKHLGFAYPNDDDSIKAVQYHIIPGPELYDELLIANSPMQQRFIDKVKGRI